MIVGLGRLPSFDSRDAEYRMSAVLPAKESKRKNRYWNEGKLRVDQGSLPACVGAGWTHYLINGPITQDPKLLPGFITIYQMAQERDEWPGNAYAGTSVRGGAKAVQELGFIGNYWWADKVEQIAQAVLELGPVVMGTPWLRSMSFPDKNGLVKVEGIEDGGHCYILNGYNSTRGIFRAEQSWYPTWGDSGNFWIEGEQLEKLMPDSEACIATEIKKVA
jgi:hypothetical protein